ncbi:MAG: family 43 glycosylhydrolase [Bacteroidota bacterium]|nr:family 43 glycosylhydrolase [Bacteroidota bacterium]
MTFIKNQHSGILLTVIGLLCCGLAFPDSIITINNLSPRYDTSGNIIDAHDGRLIKFGDTYYLYGTAYGNTDGYGTTNHFHCYKSTDLTTWTACGDMLTNPPTGVYYRPHVVYNAKHKKYVMWYNWYKTLWSGQYGIALANSPEGPYSIFDQNVTVKYLAKGVGDFNLFVDEDAKGYIVYTTIADHTITVERLTNDFMGSQQTNSGVILPSAEACSMFKHNGIYYVLADKMCQFCSEGSGVQVFTSANPLGPYNYRGNINNLERTKYPASAAIDGDRIGANWGNYGGWNDNTIGYFPDSIEFTFNGTRSISEVDVFTVQDGHPTTPTELMTFSKSGITIFDVEYWDGTSWKLIPGGSISGNNRVWRKIAFTAVSTNKIRLIIRGSQSNDFSRLIELEAYENGVNVAAKTNGGTVRASSEYLDASDNIIHAQQTYIAEIPTKTSTAYLWMADRWGSNTDGIKGHDFQYWGNPLVFNNDGSIRKLSFVNSFSLDISTENTAIQQCWTPALNSYLNDKQQLVVNSTENFAGQIRILNVSGISLLSKQLKISSYLPFIIDCSHFPKGVYIVVIETYTKRYSTKFVM